MLSLEMCIFFFNDTATTEIYTLSLHDALPISAPVLRGEHQRGLVGLGAGVGEEHLGVGNAGQPGDLLGQLHLRSEEHTSELQSRQYLVCRLLLEKKQSTTSDCTHSRPPPPPPL